MARIWPRAKKDRWLTPIESMVANGGRWGAEVGVRQRDTQLAAGLDPSTTSRKALILIHRDTHFLSLRGMRVVESVWRAQWITRRKKERKKEKTAG